MEATREIYWNVGHGVVLPMYLLTLLAFAACAYGCWKRVEVYRQGKPLNRLDNLRERVVLMATNMLGQIRVLRVAGPGIPHALFFWGFVVLFIGTLLVMAQADVSQPLFGIKILTGGFYKAYSLVLDLAGLAAIFTLFGLALRRFVARPEGLKITRDDYLMHGLLSAIIVTGFFAEGARMAATELRQNPDLARFSPIGLMVAGQFAALDLQSLKELHRLWWWCHFLLVTGFIAAIPGTKFRHLLTTPANYLFVDLRPKGSIDTIDLEAEGVEHFGVDKVADLTWKDIFDADACTSCKRCQDRCPAFNTEKPLSPMQLVQQIGDTACSAPQADLIEAVGRDTLWSCTTCRSCQEICPAQVEHVNKVIEMRRNLVLMQGEFPGEEVMVAANNVEVNGNPFGMAYAERGKWSDGLPVRHLSEGEGADILYFVGCYASFDKRNQEVAKSFVKICDAAGVSVGILGKEERCCGEPLRKLGNEYLYQVTAQENIELIKGYGVKKIVTTCPHCLNTLGRDYRDLGLDVEVEHYTVFIDRLIGDGTLALAPHQFDYTYHDSCYLGRYQGIMEQPRNVLHVAGGRINEMQRSGLESFCCGAGGGRILAEEKLGSRINVQRVKMAEATGAPLIVSNCPFCLTMFEDGIKTGDCEGKLAVRDLAEVVAERLATPLEIGKALPELSIATVTALAEVAGRIDPAPPEEERLAAAEGVSA
ncbi:heterodisulfide reductase-related iron-sulfur binding cluster [Geomonas propionica]|uniref:4Fe-4S dicluster domain-containing protein n=1 Tax=Geomonas propionica TaxID=2798582 RepID=A0ABS0YXC3_9BACT|nr:heterodisulfide reductase-related iron-sulfur binding cluster [Geomonas propionica]MBJ6802584.1 4Fe-4S dicluster domain-containing protein [Geomonas propionica]